MPKMKALVKKYAKPGLWLDEIPIPQIGINDVLVKIRKTSICGTDVHIYNWDAWAQKTIKTPMTIGHEWVGRVEAIGSNVHDLEVGELVSGEGHLVVSSHYFNKGDRVDKYLDIIHELVHIRQFMDGKELFDDAHSYVERPTEIEAYQYVVDEARKLGLSDDRICNYLKTEWISDEDLKRLAKVLNVMCG